MEIDWVSTAGSDFNRDLGFTRTEEELRPFPRGEIPPGVKQQAMSCGTAVAALPALGAIPTLHAGLCSPSVVVRAMPRAGSATGNLIIGAVRPAAGALWRAARQPVPFDSPPHVQIGEVCAGWPTRDVTGIHATPSWVAESSQTPRAYSSDASSGVHGWWNSAVRGRATISSPTSAGIPSTWPRRPVAAG